MALNFPTSPTNGQVYTDGTSGVSYVYNSSYGVWNKVNGFANGFNLIVANGNTISSLTSQTATIIAGSNIGITANADNNTIVITGSGGDISPAFNAANAAFANANTTHTSLVNNWIATNAAFSNANTTHTSLVNNWGATNAAFAKANAALANTSGVTFAGDLTITGNVGIGTAQTSTYRLQVLGAFAANTKSFLIDHPTKEGMKLRYGSLEGPENGVYVRGKSYGNTIELPDYWTGLIHEDSITVNLTPFGRQQNLYVWRIANNVVYVEGADTMSYFYTVWAERKDTDKLIVEF